jgi:ABC-type multidrug transport system fused ATPase/permease subunit
VKRALINDRFKWAFSYLKPYTFGLIGVLTLTFVQNYAYSKLPTASTGFLFELLTPENISTIYKYFLLAVGLLVVKAIFSFVATYSSEVITNAALKRIRDDLHLMSLDLGFFSERKTGNIVSIAISDVEELKRNVYMGFSGFISNIILSIIILIRLSVLNWILTLASFIVIPVLFVIVKIIGNKIRAVSKIHRKNLGGISTNIHETITGIEVVKAFANEDRENEMFQKNTKRYKQTFLKLVRFRAFLEPFSELIVLVIIMGLLGLGSVFIIRGVWEVKMMTEYLMLLAILIGPIRRVPRVVSNFKVASASIDRIRDIITVKPRIVEVENPIAKKIEGNLVFKNIWFSYDSKNDVLEDVNFQVKRGDIVALVGPSGAGKTTIANLIPRFYDCRKGKILIDGINVKDYSLKSLRTQIGIVSQNISLFNTTIRENIIYAKPDATEDEIIEAAKKAYAYEFIMELPKGFDTNVGERGVKLSGGQKQRISIARTVLMNPEILILDEATSSLDSESEYYIQLAINELMEGRTSVIIAHRLSTINHATKIVVLEKGEVVDVGNHDELIKRCALYSKIYELQYFR